MFDEQCIMLLIIRNKEMNDFFCERLRPEASMKTENREEENTGLMESLELRTVRRRDIERDRKTENSIPKSVHVCVFNASNHFCTHNLFSSFR